LLLLLDGCTGAAAAGDFLSIVSEIQSFEVHLSGAKRSGESFFQEEEVAALCL
jgi:hypothetical protein